MPEENKTESKPSSSRVVVTSEEFQAGLLKDIESRREAENPSGGTEEKTEETKKEETKPEETPEEKKKRESTERWTKMTSERKEALQEADRLRKENADLQAKLNPPEKTPLTEPDPKKYTDITKYRDDLKKWERSEVMRELQEEKTKKEVEKANGEWSAKIEAFFDKTPDARQTLMDSQVVAPDWVRDAIKSSDVGAELLYHLAKNPDIADKINAMPAISAVRYVGKLESAIEELLKVDPSKAKVIEIPTTKAPTPITPIKGGNSNSSGVVGKDADGNWISAAAYKAARKAGKV